MKTKKNVFENNFKQPEIKIKNETHLSISGNSISLRPEDSFKPLISWISGFKGDTLNIDINLDLMNCRSVKLLLEAIVAVDINENISNKNITWYFKDAEDQELGDMIASNIKNSKFKLFCMN